MVAVGEILPGSMALLLGYLLGGILTAEVVARLGHHGDVFSLGDGNPGMANVGATLGIRAAVLTLAGDVAKVVVAVVLAHLVLGLPWAQGAALAGTGATLGHDFPFWHRFRGGKGVACSCVALILMAPVMGIVSCVVGFAVVLVGGYLCWGAVAICLVGLLWSTAHLLLCATLTSAMVWVACLVLLLLALHAHGPAIEGIVQGETPRASLSTRLRERLAHLGR